MWKTDGPWAPGDLVLLVGWSVGGRKGHYISEYKFILMNRRCFSDSEGPCDRILFTVTLFVRSWFPRDAASSQRNPKFAWSPEESETEPLELRRSPGAGRSRSRTGSCTGICSMPGKDPPY